MKRMIDRAMGIASVLIVCFSLIVSAHYTYAGRNSQTYSADKSNGIPPGDAVEAFRAERAQVREIEMLQLNAVAADEGADSDVRNEARRELVALSRYMEMENTIEGILSIRGFQGCCATVHSDSVNVVVKRESLSLEESAMILELVMRETGQTAGNVKIMTVGKDEE